MNILINAFGISSAGGITVLKSTIKEFQQNNNNTYFIFAFKNNEIESLESDFRDTQNIYFKIYVDYGILFRLIFENIFFLIFVSRNNVRMVYNLSGTNQLFLRKKSLLKVQNLLYFTKKLDLIYLKKNQKKAWIKQLLIKRFIFKTMLTLSKNVEVQSEHVVNELENFVNMSNKRVFIKNDFNIDFNYSTLPKKYNFNKKIIFLFIVGPHFDLVHKNFEDFVNAMLLLRNEKFNFEIKITLDYQQLNKSDLWDDKLNNLTTFLGYISKNKDFLNLFSNNTILISTSVIETLGLHVIESTLNGIISIVPNEPYSESVYGDNSQTYKLMDPLSLKETIMNLKKLNNPELSKIIVKNQNYIQAKKKKKYNNSLTIIEHIIKS